MKFFVQYTFDLDGSKSHNYPDIERLLSGVGLTKIINSQKALIVLPGNTYAGFIEGNTESEVLDSIREIVRQASSKWELEGKAFYTVSSAIVFEGCNFKNGLVHNVRSDKV